MTNKKKICFFTNEPMDQLLKEQYTIQDINILKDLNFNVVIANSFKTIPYNCDLYFSWWASGSIIPFIKAKLNRKPIIIVAGGNEAMFYRDSLDKQAAGYLATPFYKKIATKITLKYSDAILVVSKFMLSDVIKLGAKLPYVVYNSVDTDKFIPSSLEKKYITTIMGLEKKTVKLKRGFIFIEAIAIISKKLPDQEFLIIGSKDDAFHEIFEIAKKIGIADKLKIIGSVNNSEIINWLQQTKVYVQISDTETFGVAVAEAMSCGVPVVVSRRGALPEVVGEYGEYVNNNDPWSVALGIEKILKMKQNQLNTLSQILRMRIIQEFSYENRKNSIRNIISMVTNNNQVY